MRTNHKNFNSQTGRKRYKLLHTFIPPPPPHLFFGFFFLIKFSARFNWVCRRSTGANSQDALPGVNQLRDRIFFLFWAQFLHHSYQYPRFSWTIHKSIKSSLSNGARSHLMLQIRPKKLGTKFSSLTYTPPIDAEVALMLRNVKGYSKPRSPRMQITWIVVRDD